MRDINRIKPFCDELARIWSENVSDWRFNQFICNIYRELQYKGYDPFYIEDDKMLRIIRDYFKVED